MSSRISVLSLQNIYMWKNKFNFHLVSYFGSKYCFSSSCPNISHSSTHESLKSIQFPKYVKPHVNQTIDEILSNINSKSLSPNESVSILKVLRMHTMFKNVECNSFKEDKRFKILCQTFENSCCSMKPNMLVSGLRSLLEVGIPPESSCVISAEKCVINNINSFSSFTIICCLYFHHKLVQTDLQKSVVFLLISELCKHVSLISTNSEILMLVHFLHIFDEKQLKIIQQKVIEFIPLLNTSEMCKILSTLSENSNRNVFILNAISFYLKQKIKIPDIKEVLSILYSLKNLNFYDGNLLSYLMNKIVLEIPFVTQPSIISGLLTTCGHLKWKQTEILKACGEWIISHLEVCRMKEYASYILTAATLNYNNSEMKKVLLTILPHVKFENVESPDIWLDIVWSLVVLEIVEKETLLKVLSPDFYKSLIEGSDYHIVTNKLKLMNLKAVLKMHHPECIFRCDLHLEPTEVPHSKSIENSRKHVIKVLNNFLPKDKYMYVNQNTNIGIFIDAEFIMDKSIKPLPLSKFGVLAKGTDIHPLPEGSQRIALLTLFYKDYTLHTSSFTGCNALAIRLLSDQGFTVVWIPFEEFIRNNTEVKKAKYVLQKITKAMKNKISVFHELKL